MNNIASKDKYDNRSKTQGVFSQESKLVDIERDNKSDTDRVGSETNDNNKVRL